MKKTLFILLVLAIILNLTGCGPGEVKADRERIIDPQVTLNEMSTLINGNNSFAFDLYQELKIKDGNLLYSPYSISLALAMTYAGARGETERQMADVLHFDLPQEKLHLSFNNLDSELARRGDENENLRLKVVNALWGQRDYIFLEDFLVTLAENYGAGMKILDFIKSPEGSRLTINNWVSDQTEGRIKDLIPQGQEIINPNTRLVLTNTIYFRAEWEYKFLEPGYTKNRPFYLKDGRDVNVPMMSGEVESLNFARADGYQAVELPYKGEKLSMVVILPDTGKFDEFEEMLDATLVEMVINNLEIARVQINMPRFSFESGFLLKEALSKMGMPVAFGNANFSGITGSADLYIRDVVHKAWISVDEAGTEAGAATAVVMEGMAEEVINITVDHPFIFLIQDIETGTILFVGRVLNPLES